MKKYISFLSILAIVLSLTTTTFAATEKPKSELTPEQQAIIDSYTSNSVVSVDILTDGKSTVSPSATAASTTYRGSLKRGSELFMWTEDFVQWTTNGSTISTSTAWQKCGYFAPNYARVNGITKQSYSTPEAHTYRASKTCGGKLITPFGEFEIYNQDFIDLLTAYPDGNMDVQEDV